MNHEVNLRVETFESINLRLQRALFLEDNMRIGVGDTIELLEHDVESGRFSGRWLKARVTHAQRMTIGGMLPRQMIVLSIEKMSAGQGSPYFLDVSGSRRAA